jgi:hypothetical protein
MCLYKATSLELYIDLENEAEEGSIFQLRAKFQFEDFTSTHFIPLTQKECPVDPKRITEKITHSKSQLLQSTLTALESLEIVTKNYSFISLTEDTMKVLFLPDQGEERQSSFWSRDHHSSKHSPKV